MSSGFESYRGSPVAPSLASLLPSSRRHEGQVASGGAYAPPPKRQIQGVSAVAMRLDSVARSLAEIGQTGEVASQTFSADEITDSVRDRILLETATAYLTQTAPLREAASFLLLD